MGDLKLSKELKEKFVRFRSGKVRDRVRDKDRQSEAINFGTC